MAEYLIRSNAGETGPVSFRELARLIQQGEVSDDVMVRETGATDWLPAVEVPGLLRAAKRTLDAASDGNTSPGENPASDTTASALPKPKKSVGILSVGIGGIVLIGLSILVFVMTRTPRFPEPTLPATVQGLEMTLQQMLPALPDLPSLVIPRKTPVLVPGLEDESDVASPSLSDDLLNIVFLKKFHGQHDVFHATRSDKTKPFGKASRLSCSTFSNEAFCSLSPDGSELLYTVQGTPSRLFLATNASQFAVAERLVIEGFEPSDEHQDNVQWLSQNRIRFAISKSDFSQRVQQFAEREAPGKAFHVTTKLKMQNPWPRIHVSPDESRASFVNASGIHVTAAKVKVSEFGMGHLLFGTDVIGPVNDQPDTPPLYVVPKGDVIFFAGPGLSPPETDSVPPTKLWMIRI